MKNGQDEKITILKNIDGKELTRKELNDLGINDYYIKVFRTADIISCLSRGRYKVSFAKNEKNENSHTIYQLFNRFKYKVLNGKYVEAYEALMENYKLQNSHDYDNHMRIYFILLKVLIGNRFDFTPLEELYEFTEDKSDTYYDYFIDFRESIMAGNFYDAKMYLEKYALEEKKSSGFNNISTILFTNMLEDVLKKTENFNNTQANRERFNDSYGKLVRAIINQEYQEALKYIEGCIFSSQAGKMTSMMKKIRDMLNDLISLKGDNINIKPKRIDYSKTSSIYSKFDWALNAKDYFMAQEFIEEIMKNDDSGHYKTMKRLLDAILKTIRDKNVKEQESKLEERIIDPETFKKMNSPLDSLSAYKIFLKEYEDKHYESALYHLEISMLKNKEITYKNNNEKVCSLLKELIDMQKNKRGFIEMNIDYSDCTNVSMIFNKALENRDFKTAFKNSGKMTYQNTSKTLVLFSNILHTMFDLDKKYGNVKVSAGEEKTSEVLPSEKVNYSDDLLTTYVNERKYEELFSLLQEKKKTKSLNRLEHNVFRLIKIYNSILKGYYEEPNHIYTSNEIDYLGRFFEAIRCEDIYIAYGEIASIYGIIKDKHEFDIFEIILKDCIDLKEDLEAKKKSSLIDEEILTNINNLISDKKELNTDDLDTLYEYIYKLQDNSTKETVEIISDIVEFIELANKKIIDARYFADLNQNNIIDDGAKITFQVPDKQADALMFYLRNGDYISALKNINYLDINEFTKKERMVLKNLLVILNNTLQRSKEYSIQYEEIPENHLSIIKRFIKKYDFLAAFNYVLEHDLDDEILYEIFPIIFDSMVLTFIEQEEMYRDFYDFIASGKKAEARANMLSYKEKLDNSSLGEIQSLQEKYEEMKKRLQK